jgi:thioredoxin-related protein
MKKILLFVFLMGGMLAMAQTTDKGMNFEHDLTWKAIQAKAKKENKIIFVDAFTTWCGPCKLMAKKIFPLEEVGNFYNANFINVKVQLDTTKNDNAEVVRWYADAHDIMVRYNVRVFPTYLFISPDGKLLHRAVGSSDATTFIAKGKKALDPATQYYTLKDKFDNGQREPELLKALALAAEEAYDEANQPIFVNAYLGTQKDLFTEENIRFVSKLTTSSKDKGFELMLKNPAAFDAVLGAGSSKSTIRNIVMQEDVFSALFSRTGAPVKWEELEKSLQTKYPAFAAEFLGYAKVNYFMSQGNWEKFAPAVTSYMQQFGADVSPVELNNFAWAVFENCADMNCVEQAVEWAKRATAAKDPNYLDTYANLLYKTGKREEAIKAQEATVALAKATNHENLNEFENVLQKMKEGKKTW